ncbi:MAG: GH3 auxin-responsive promoter family protein, partial [Anaerolineales bacterium]
MRNIRHETALQLQSFFDLLVGLLEAGQHLINRAKATAFGLDHGFSDMQSHDDFRRQVPIRDYEALSPYVNR